MQGRRGFVARRGVAVVPAWTIATVLSMVVATVGIQEIASRVADPLQLDGRAGGGLDDAGVLELASRQGTGRFGEVDADPSRPIAPTSIESVPLPVRAVSPAPGPIGEPMIALAPGADGWDLATGPDSQTRWARNGTGPDGQPTHQLEYANAAGEYEPGYGNNADATLTTPWIDVPAGPGLLSIGIWSRMFTEPIADGYDLAFTADGTTWTQLDRVSGGAKDDPVFLRTFELQDVGAQRLRVRLAFTSDLGGSAWDRGVPGLAKGEHLEVHRVGLVRSPSGRHPSPDLGVPHRSFVPDVADTPQVVMALSSEEINPYHPEFRDPSPRAYAHPSTYIEGYPTDAIAVWLSLDAPDFAAALERDLDTWRSLSHQQLYWFPGTRIVGGIVPTDTRDGFEGCLPVCIGATPACPETEDEATFCHLEGREDDLGDRSNGLPYVWAPDATSRTAAAAGSTVGTCPKCLVVAVDTYSASGIRWALDQPWIDLQGRFSFFDGTVDSTANAASSLASPECLDANECRLDVARDIFEAVDRQLVVANSMSFERADPVHSQPIAGAPGVVTVAGHDNGHVAAPRTGSHVAANYCAVLAPADYSLGLVERGVDFRMAAARATGIYASTLLTARRLLGDLGHGARDGALAAGTAGRLGAGPLADGRLTVAEWRRVVEATASPRPTADADGPRCHDGSSPHRDDDGGPRGHTTPTSLGQAWDAVPDGFPTHTMIGWGAIDTPDAQAAALAVLRGELTLPSRPEVDAWFADDHRLRLAIMWARSTATGVS